jgi:DNA-binding transcriptional LysR family regulator
MANDDSRWPIIIVVNLSNVNLNLLYVLHVLLAERSATRAAARLHVTQSAVSNALARLREEMGDPLLVREGRRLSPTPRALALEPTLSLAVAGFEAVLRQGQPFDPAQVARRWTIAASDYVETVLLPDLLHRLRERSPGSTLAVAPVDAAIHGRALHNGDVSLMLGVFPEAPASCRAAEVWRDEMVCIVRRDHPRARKSLSLDLLADLDHILVAQFGARVGPVDQALQERGRARRIALTVPRFLTVPATVATSDCIATVPRRLAERFAEPFGLRLLAPPLPIPGFTIQALWHERSQDDPGDRFLRSLVHEVASGRRIPDRRARRPRSRSRR